MTVNSVSVTIPRVDPADSGAAPASGEGAGTPAERPAYVPEKFWDSEKGEPRLEEAFGSYAALETKLGGGELPAVEPDVDPAPSTAPTEGLFTEAKMAEYGAALAGEGLTEAQLADFAAANIPQEIVDRFIGSIETETNAVDDAVVEVMGSREKFTEAAEWLRDNGTDAQIATYNDAVNTGSPAAAKAAAENLKALHKASTSSPAADRVNGTQSQVQTGPELFQGWGDLTASVKNPLYKTSESYRAKHDARLKASVAAGKIS